MSSSLRREVKGEEELDPSRDREKLAIITVHRADLYFLVAS
jgi:hypothetical protein